MKRTSLILAVAGVSAAAAAPASAATQPAPVASLAAPPVVTLSGSTSVFPLAQALTKRYRSLYPARARFKITQGGSDVGINEVSRGGAVKIGMSSRERQSSDPSGLNFIHIGSDGICVVTNPNNPVANFDTETVEKIFSGKITNWSAVPGAKVSGPIDLVVRTAASGTQDAFRNIFMGGPKGPNVASSASQKASNALVQSSVRSNENAVGYVDYRFTAGTHAVPYKGVGCTATNAKNGSYPGLRRLFFVVKGRPSGATLQFLRWTVYDAKAKSVVSSNWVPPKR